MAASPTAPLDLPRLLMRRSLVVALGGLALALALGLLRAHDDTRQEIDGAMALARLSGSLSSLATQSDADALAALRAIGEPRHLQLRVVDALGANLLQQPAAAEPGWPLRGLMALGRRLDDASSPPRAVSWQVERPGGGAWTLSLVASDASEQHEALGDLLTSFSLFAGCCALMLAVMHWNMRRAFRPLQPMLQAIARVEQQDLQPLRALPSMPIRELDVIATALKHLAGALERAEAARRLLSHKLLTLQEDERQRLARDLHDEFGQRLTALRVDAAWLSKRVAGQAELERVVAGMGEQCARIQHDVRATLAQLRPLGHGDGTDGTDRDTETPSRLRALLESLVAGWSTPAARGMRHALHLSSFDDGAQLPRELVLSVYRITQEALTNVARHARASRATVDVRITPGALHWAVEDDGAGIADTRAAFQQGNGLAGIQERVWALGGEFSVTWTHEARTSGPSPSGAGAGGGGAAGASGGSAPGAGSGCRLEARLPLDPASASSDMVTAA